MVGAEVSLYEVRALYAMGVFFGRADLLSSPETRDTQFNHVNIQNLILVRYQGSRNPPTGHI
jgi:hypothetical protein